MAELAVRIAWLPDADQTLGLPARQTEGSAGFDLRANFGDRGAVMLAPGEITLIPTGLQLEIPPGFEAQVRPRSGLALRHRITLPNSPGTIDSDYRGPLGVIMHNGGAVPFTVNHGDRIAQMVFAPVLSVAWHVVAAPGKSDRGVGGFGSTGV
ncbi:MAG: dUTP diphosphatase [Rhodobacteraceae bacterium]|nr:dUTP diphosphatase [Paracoccaceae bacterium]